MAAKQKRSRDPVCYCQSPTASPPNEGLADTYSAKKTSLLVFCSLLRYICTVTRVDGMITARLVYYKGEIKEIDSYLQQIFTFAGKAPER